jgi:hypothetical protein
VIRGGPVLPKGWKPTSDTYADNTVGYSFSYHLLTPSKNFIKNMGEAEKKLLLEHAQYLKEAGLHFEDALDPDKQYGLVAWLQDATEMEIRKIAANDPAIKANLGFHVRYHKVVSIGPKCRPVVRDETGKEVSW